jgi:outer membrane protein assembly factor BamD
MTVRHDRMRWLIALPVLAALLLVGCSSTDPALEDPLEAPAEDLYNAAANELDAGRFAEAAKAFEEVERQHPYSAWATQAQVMAAYAHYEGNEYDAAIAAAQRFIELHPGHKSVPYAYYLIALSNYEQISDVRRDQGMTARAKEALQEVVQRFPNSDYARDAKLKLDLVQDHLAGKEMDIGRYYQRRRQFVGAINRFRAVVENYQTTTHVPEALARLTECYLALGVRNEAQNAAAVLGYNFPGSEWYAYAYALLKGESLEPFRDEDSWLAGIF